MIKFTGLAPIRVNIKQSILTLGRCRLAILIIVLNKLTIKFVFSPASIIPRILIKLWSWLNYTLIILIKAYTVYLYISVVIVIYCELILSCALFGTVLLINLWVLIVFDLITLIHKECSLQIIINTWTRITITGFV